MTDANNQNAAIFAPGSDDVFARIAGRYDRLCDVFSLGIHRLWKAHMARRAAAADGATILDVASGTGDIPLRLLRQGTRATTVWVTDLCPQMLEMAQAKLADPRVRFALRNAEDLVEVADGSVDLFTMSFGMKICDRARVMAEAHRVLKPGGRFLCLEAARIPVPWVHMAYLKYMDWCLPLIGWLAADGDRSAYDYLLRGVHGFPAQAELARELEAVGFADVRYTNLTFGIVALHEAVKPNQPS
ncbi:MAG TPA: ubiquinone/menaquinone biosynthesis methyltransferase [Rhizomicrobium sp.]|nr:ubiquinone/menaquinone biosynthesis methyltransferase [Rhizomicrobium sp.]